MSTKREHQPSSPDDSLIIEARSEPRRLADAARSLDPEISVSSALDAFIVRANAEARERGGGIAEVVAAPAPRAERIKRPASQPEPALRAMRLEAERIELRGENVSRVERVVGAAAAERAPRVAQVSKLDLEDDIDGDATATAADFESEPERRGSDWVLAALAFVAGALVMLAAGSLIDLGKGERSAVAKAAPVGNVEESESLPPGARDRSSDPKSPRPGTAVAAAIDKAESGEAGAGVKGSEPAAPGKTVHQAEGTEIVIPELPPAEPAPNSAEPTGAEELSADKPVAEKLRDKKSRDKRSRDKKSRDKRSRDKKSRSKKPRAEKSKASSRKKPRGKRARKSPRKKPKKKKKSDSGKSPGIIDPF